jgi:epsilon-lactone hydrolase
VASVNFQKYLKILQDQPSGDQVNVEAMRKITDKVGGRFPDGVTSEVVSAGGVPAEMIQDADAATDRVMLYLHGGGYVAGSIDSHRNLTGNLAKAAGLRVLALHYRLAPENPHPAPVEDAVAAYRWLLDEGYEAGHIVISGDSAGGGLALATLIALRDQGVALPAAAVPLSPWVDMEGEGESMTTRADADPMVAKDMLLQMTDLFLGGGDPKDPLAAPLHADLAGLPPLLIQVGDAEVLLDDSTRFAAKAEAAGVDVSLEVWPEMVHVFQTAVGFVPEAGEAVARIAEFSREKVGLA